MMVYTNCLSKVLLLLCLRQPLFRMSKTILACNTSAMSKHNEAKLWHMHLCHIPFANMKFVYPSLDVSGMQCDVFCTICPQARQARLSFSSSSIQTHSPFELLHIDVWGPNSSPTYGGCNYFLNIFDDFTRCIWVFS